jgi:hypothetical protein
LSQTQELSERERFKVVSLKAVTMITYCYGFYFFQGIQSLCDLTNMVSLEKRNFLKDQVVV